MRAGWYIISFLFLGFIASVWSDDYIPSTVVYSGAAGARIYNSFKLENVGNYRNASLASEKVTYPAEKIKKIYKNSRILLPLANLLGEPKADEWRALWKEPSQSYLQYARDSNRRQATNLRNTIVVQTVGNLTSQEEQALHVIIEVIEAYYGLKVKVNKPIILKDLPNRLFRSNTMRRQINVEAFMQEYLQPEVKDNVVSVLAYTSEDLWPGEKWPFDSTFGWSSFYARTAIISTKRVVVDGVANSKQNILRLCKLATHEIGHTFTFKHCDRYECNMNGRGSVQENDYKPLWLCPDCLAKLSLATGRNIEDYCQDMYEVTRKHGFKREANYYSKALRLLRNKR